jgi:hypothetical protein
MAQYCHGSSACARSLVPNLMEHHHLQSSKNICLPDSVPTAPLAADTGPSGLPPLWVWFCRARVTSHCSQLLSECHIHGNLLGFPQTILCLPFPLPLPTLTPPQPSAQFLWILQVYSGSSSPAVDRLCIGVHPGEVSTQTSKRGPQKISYPARLFCPLKQSYVIGT